MSDELRVKLTTDPAIEEGLARVDREVSAFASAAFGALGQAAIVESERIKREAEEFADNMKRAAREFREGEPLNGAGGTDG